MYTGRKKQRFRDDLRKIMICYKSERNHTKKENKERNEKLNLLTSQFSRPFCLKVNLMTDSSVNDTNGGNSWSVNFQVWLL